jgi:hypothetical protein
MRTMAEEKNTPQEGAGLQPELLAEVYRALNFDPEEFARRHAEEFTHQYLRLDGMLSHVGEEIVAYLSKRVNECLSKAEYALLSYIEYASRGELPEDFNEAVAHYLCARREAGEGWVYAFERDQSKAYCLSIYPQMHAIAQAMYTFAKETGEFKEIAWTDGPAAWPDPKKLNP